MRLGIEVGIGREVMWVHPAASAAPSSSLPTSCRQEPVWMLQHLLPAVSPFSPLSPPPGSVLPLKFSLRQWSGSEESLEVSQCVWARSSSVGADCPKRKLLTPCVISLGCCFISVFAPLPPVQTPFPGSAEWDTGCGLGSSMALRGLVLAFLLVLLPQLGKQRESSGAGAVSGKTEEGKREEGKLWLLLSLQKKLLLSSPCKLALHLSLFWLMAVCWRGLKMVSTSPEALRHHWVVSG